MLENVFPVKDLRSLARLKKQSNDFKTIPTDDLQLALEDGWVPQRQSSRSVRLSRPKRKSALLEDRVWFLLYRMGFTHLSGRGGATVAVDTDKPNGPRNQIDVVGLESEIALAIECKSAETPKKSQQFQSDLAKLSVVRERFIQAVHKQFPIEHKRVPVLALFTWDLILTDNDIPRATELGIVLMDEHDLDYYEQLVTHLGPAAKYQFFADMLPGRRVRGLGITVPAIRAKMGKYTCYNFSITPEYLLKVAYVSHRAKGKATDVNTYQRMIKRSRLKKIRKYITDQGIFPTNIVINFDDKRHLRFDYGPQEGGPEGAKYGTLHLTPAYKAAWIIDGQHRLFAYSGHERAATSWLNVLAFENLPPDRQAQLFIDINHEQKSVKQNLLQELYAELHWYAKDEATRIGAIVSKAVLTLDEAKDSPFYQRIMLTDDVRTPTRCITLNTLFRAINQPGMLVVKPGIEYGPLWAGNNDQTLRRMTCVLKEWFGIIAAETKQWWNLGSDEGGGLAMNDGVVVCTGVLRSVLSYLKAQGYPLLHLSNEELADVVRPYGQALGEYLGQLSLEERRAFRAGARGVQGQTAKRRQCEKALHDRCPDFEPPGLKEAMELEAARTNEQAYAIIQHVEKTLRRIVVDTLKDAHGQGDGWWYNGVPPKIRRKVNERIDDELGTGGREDYFDLLDFREIAMKNWPLFQSTLGYGRRGNKEKRTEWIAKLNEARKIVMHPAKGRVVGWDQLEDLRNYRAALDAKAEGLELNEEVTSE